MRTIILYVGGTVLFLMLLGFADSNLPGLTIALMVLAAAGVWLFEPAMVRFRSLDPDFRSKTWAGRARSMTSLTFDLAWEYRQNLSNTEHRTDERFGTVVEGWLFLVASVLLALVGLSILSDSILGWRFIALLLGVLLVAAAWWLSRRYSRRRQEWRENAPRGRLMEGGHAIDQLLFLAGIPILAIFGIYLVATAV